MRLLNIQRLDDARVRWRGAALMGTAMLTTGLVTGMVAIGGLTWLTRPSVRTKVFSGRR